MCDKYATKKYIEQLISAHEVATPQLFYYLKGFKSGSTLYVVILFWLTPKQNKSIV